jgi:hypothetical protein
LLSGRVKVAHKVFVDPQAVPSSILLHSHPVLKLLPAAHTQRLQLLVETKTDAEQEKSLGYQEAGRSSE